VPSCDGTIYSLDPKDGKVRWAFDTTEPVRSSPAVDADGNVYVGSGEGRLFVLNPNGTLRFSMRLIDADRNDLNASPALGQDAIYIGGESGEVFSVPYDYCLRAEAKSDARCTTTGGEGLPDGVNLLFTTSFGALVDPAPATVDPNQPLSFTLVVREHGDSELAILDAKTLDVKVTPAAAVDLAIAGDGKFVTVAPRTTFVGDAGGKVTVELRGKYLHDLHRDGLKLSGGSIGGSFDGKFSFTLTPAASFALPLPTPAMPGDPNGVWEVSRLALPLPTILPSYNQIGFDSLHYLVGIVEGDGAAGVAWMIGAKLADNENRTIVDPATKALLPLTLAYDGGGLTLANQDGLTVGVMNVDIPFKTFRMAARLDAKGNATGSGVRVNGSTVCAGIPTYGMFLETLGLCNPETDVLSVFGGADFAPFDGGSGAAPKGLGTVALTAKSGQIRADISGGSLKVADHVAAILLVDAALGTPVSLDYGLVTARKAAADGTLASVTLSTSGAKLPTSVRAYLMIDTYPAAVATLSP
jgi:hypothetical protein